MPDNGELTDLRDALDDAIRRAYCEPVVSVRDGEDAAVVRSIEVARLLQSPERMRHLAGVQAAAWAVVCERVEDVADAR